jgi:hypothetical protein
MRNVKVLILGIIAVVASSFTLIENGGEKTVNVTVAWEFKGIVDGYDHNTKTELYIDGKLVATSTEKKESKPNSVSATTTRGSHDIKVINYAQYEGSWEAHTIANNYSIDCTYQETVNCKKKNNNIRLLFDLDSGTKRVK